jgi:hypothetical protein
MLSPAERAPLERVLRNHGITTDERAGPDQDTNNPGEKLPKDPSPSPSPNPNPDSNPKSDPNPSDTDWSEKL